MKSITPEVLFFEEVRKTIGNNAILLENEILRIAPQKFRRKDHKKEIYKVGFTQQLKRYCWDVQRAYPQANTPGVLDESKALT